MYFKVEQYDSVLLQQNQVFLNCSVCLDQFCRSRRHVSLKCVLHQTSQPLHSVLPFIFPVFVRYNPPHTLLLLLRVLQQPLPLDRLREHLPLQPHLVAVVKVVGQLHALTQYALQAVVHGREVAVPVAVVAPAVELLDALPQGALLRLEVPGPGVDI